MQLSSIHYDTIRQNGYVANFVLSAEEYAALKQRVHDIVGTYDHLSGASFELAFKELYGCKLISINGYSFSDDWWDLIPASYITSQDTLEFELFAGKHFGIMLETVKGEVIMSFSGECESEHNISDADFKRMNDVAYRLIKGR